MSNLEVFSTRQQFSRAREAGPATSLDGMTEARGSFLPQMFWAKHVAKELRTLLDGRLMRMQDLLAYIYGYPSWNQMRTAMTKQEAEFGEFDEYLQPEALARRLYFQARRVHEWSGMDLKRSCELIDRFRPSAFKRTCQSLPEDGGDPSEEELDAKAWSRVNDLPSPSNLKTGLETFR